MNGAAPSARSWIAASVATAATYVYFLIFAQFALLALATRAGETARLRELMGAMGAGGLVGAVAAAFWFSPARARAQLVAGFVACGLGAQLATVASTWVHWIVVFAMVGLALGALTVTLAASLRAAAGTSRLGLAVGVGTGAAYAICNLPPIFTADPRAQAWVAVVAAAAGVVAAGNLAAHALEKPTAPERATLVRWVVALTALVWMDSAVFYVIQQTPQLRAPTWEGAGNLLANATVHLAAGVAAGWMLDRGWRRAPAVAGIALLAAASLMLAGWLPGMAPGWLYVAGVSLYSVVLVYFPAATARAGVAAAVYGVAGWIGSALGIGMAQDLARVPVWFVGVALVAVFVALGSRRAAVFTLAVVALGVAPRGEADDIVARGREIYIREGCIHCHSQYVRPHVALDVERWGPATKLEQLLAGAPPLPGNRRQGPDLANVGNRRSAEWNRLHLREPRVVSPGSRMPSYAHLFRGGDESDGEALVHYLASLGAETIPERLTQVRAWRPAPAAVIGDAAARRLFAELCAQCHGDGGRGDGALAARLSVRPPDWSAGAWRQVPAGADVELELARIIKFGLPGSPMAGHEYLRDEEIVGLARVVQAWQKTTR